MAYPSWMTFPGGSLFPGAATTQYRFEPPYTVHGFQLAGALIGGLRYGLTVMRIAGEWVETEFPTWAQEQAADVVYRGGAIHELTLAEAEALTAAGYEVTEYEQ